MSKKMIAVMLGVCLLLGMYTTANAGGVWSMVKNIGLENRTPIKTFVLEVEGVNIRGYVFDVPEMKSVCISMWGENTQQMECKTYTEMTEVAVVAKAVKDN